MTAPDDTLDRLLDLDGEIMEVGGGYRVEISARLVPEEGSRPHGVNYSLCLYHPKSGERIICYDNAHPIVRGSGPAAMQSRVNDHKHLREQVTPYRYTDAGTLLVDFWNDVYEFLRKEGVL